MEPQRVRKTCNYQLMPPPEPEQTWETVVGRCRERYNAGLQERNAGWEQCRVCVNVALQAAPVPALKEVRPDYRARNAPVVQDVVHRREQTVPASVRGVHHGAPPGSPRLPGRERCNRCTAPPVGGHGGAVLDGAGLRRSTSGRIPRRRHRPRKGTAKIVPRSRAAAGW